MLDTGVEIFFVFTNDHDVHDRMLGLYKRMIGNTRANISEEAERLTHGDVKTLEAAALGRGDRRLKKNFGATQRIPGAGLDTRSVSGQVNLLADVYCFYLEVRPGFLENMQGGGHDLRADAVAVRNGDRDRLRHIGRDLSRIN